MTERNYWQRMRRNRVSRRDLLRASGRAGVGAAGLALVGCGGDDDDDQQSVAQSRSQQQQQDQGAQQQAGQQQSGQQGAQQQTAQQQDADQAADQAAQQATQQEDADDAAQDAEQQQAAVSSIVRRRRPEILDAGGDTRLLRPASRGLRAHPVLDGLLHELPDPLAQQGAGDSGGGMSPRCRRFPTQRLTSSTSIKGRGTGISIQPRAVGSSPPTTFA